MTDIRQSPPAETLDALAEIERQVLWLSTAIVHHANRVRANPGGLKVGGHQASSASMVSIMTSLWFRHLHADDRVSVKPHASPVLHAINYLLGELDESYLPMLRAFGGLQSYPSRVKDPDPVDYSTGSVGIGATAPIWGAVARRYLSNRFTAGGPAATGRQDGPAAPGRQYSLLGDAELDEGAVWEAIVDPGVAELGEIVWVVDVNRQSLDRVVPLITAGRLRGMFSAAGWQVITLKYGRLLEELFTRPGGEALRHRIDAMPNPEYQRLLRCHPDELRSRLPGGDESLARLVSDLDDAELARAIRNLGGHDLSSLDEAYEAIDDSRPTIILAYTIKGYGLAVEGHPQNHSALLTEAQLGELAAQLGADPGQPWRRPAAGSAAAGLCGQTARRLRRAVPPRQAPPAVPQDLGRSPAGVATTQAALGRALLDLSAAGPRPLAGRGGHHPGRAGPGPARPDPRGPRGSRAGRHGQPGCQLEHQPGRLGEQGRRVVGRRTDRLVRRRRRDDPALAGEADRAAHRARHRRDQPGRPARRARRDLEPLGAAAVPDRGAVRPVRGAGARAVVVRHLRGRPVDPGSRSWSARRPGFRSPPRAGRISPSPRHPSGSSSQAA
jgi:pyruvate dehydrogenase E1 component